MNKTERIAKTETTIKLFDKKNDRFITRHEFLKVKPVQVQYHRLHYNTTVTFIPDFQVSKKLDATQVEAVFARFNVNDDGWLSMEEFRQLMGKR